MATADENSRIMRAYWPEWRPAEALAALYRSKLGACDQAVLREAIDAHRLANDWQEPKLSALLSEYDQRIAERRRRDRDAGERKRIADMGAPAKPLFVCGEDDPAVVRDCEALIAGAEPSGFKAVEKAILDRLDRGLSSRGAYRLLRRARADLLGQDGPGLSQVTARGDIRPIGEEMHAEGPSGPQEGR